MRVLLGKNKLIGGGHALESVHGRTDHKGAQGARIRG